MEALRKAMNGCPRGGGQGGCGKEMDVTGAAELFTFQTGSAKELREQDFLSAATFSILTERPHSTSTRDTNLLRKKTDGDKHPPVHQVNEPYFIRPLSVESF